MLAFCWVILALLSSLFRWSMCRCEKHFFRFWLLVNRLFCGKEAHAVLWGCLTHRKCSSCVCLLFCFTCSISSCCCSGNSVFLGSVSHLIRHGYSKVMCQLYVTWFSLLASCYSFCIVGRDGQFQSVTFPVSNVATAYRLGACDKLVTLQGLQWKLTIQEFLQSYIWDYLIN